MPRRPRVSFPGEACERKLAEMPIVEGSARPSALAGECHSHGSHGARWNFSVSSLADPLAAPALICGLLLATVAAFASVAYWHVERALARRHPSAAPERRPSDGRACCRPRRSSAWTRRAGSPATPEIAALAAPELGPGVREAAEATVKAFLKSSPQTVGVEVWRDSASRGPVRGREARRLITSVQALPTKPNTPPPPPRQERLIAHGPTPLAVANDLVYDEVMGQAAGGSVVRPAAACRLPPASEAFSRLAGDVSMLFGAPKRRHLGGSRASSRGRRSSRGRTTRPTTKMPAGRVRSARPSRFRARPGRSGSTCRDRSRWARPTRSSPECCRSAFVVALIGAAVTWVLAEPHHQDRSKS